MKKISPAWLWLAAVLVTTGLLWAKDNPHWLTAGEEQALEATVPPPPVPHSPEDAANLKAEVNAQTTRTPERIAEAKADASYSPALFAAAIAPDFNKEKYPLTFDLIKGVNRELGAIVHEAKSKWKRPRPYLTHSEIKPLFTAGDYSYPSGHATDSFAYAVVLGAIFPDKAEALLARAKAIAQSRVDAGVHYTSDIREGEVLGKAIGEALLAKPAFQAAVAKAKAEAQARAKT